MTKNIFKNNDLALSLIILVVLGLFLYYEFGFNLNLFNVGAGGRHHQKNHRFLNHPYNIFLCL